MYPWPKYKWRIESGLFLLIGWLAALPLAHHDGAVLA